MKLYQRFAQNMATIDKARNSKQPIADVKRYVRMASEQLDALDKMLPHGSGIDAECRLDRHASRGERLVFSFSFHHMNENGYYCGWTSHSVIVKPSLQFGTDIRVVTHGSPRAPWGWNDYAHELWNYALNEECEYPALEVAQ